MDKLNEKFIDPIEDNDINKIIKLINKGANIHYLGNQPLCLSAEMAHCEIAKLLIDNGADVDAVFIEDNLCPIDCATRYGHPHILDLLFQKNTILKKESNEHDD